MTIDIGIWTLAGLALATPATTWGDCHDDSHLLSCGFSVGRRDA